MYEEVPVREIQGNTRIIPDQEAAIINRIIRPGDHIRLPAVRIPQGRIQRPVVRLHQDLTRLRADHLHLQELVAVAEEAAVVLPAEGDK
jgi:hypothetical protein